MIVYNTFPYFLIAKNNIQPNIVAFQNFEEDEKFNNASVLGSLIKIESSEINTGKIDEGSLFAEKSGMSTKKIMKCHSQKTFFWRQISN
jgi:hypothetical protein